MLYKEGPYAIAGTARTYFNINTFLPLEESSRNITKFKLILKTGHSSVLVRFKLKGATNQKLTWYYFYLNLVAYGILEYFRLSDRRHKLNIKEDRNTPTLVKSFTLLKGPTCEIPTIWQYPIVDASLIGSSPSSVCAFSSFCS